MALKRMVLEIGMGNDLHGGDYTKAAIRAVQDAIHHSSLTFVRSLGVDRNAVRVEVSIGVQQPDKVDREAVKRTLPMGQISVDVVKGGLDVPDREANDLAVIATAAVVGVERGGGRAAGASAGRDDHRPYAQLPVGYRIRICGRDRIVRDAAAARALRRAHR